MGKPEIKRRLLCGGLVLGLTGILSGGALAAPPETQPGKTSVGVQTADLAPESLSYTVPLYLTVAAAKSAAGEPTVVVPMNYSMKNTTGSTFEGRYPGIAVTDVEVQAVESGTWSLRQQPASGKEIMLSIGGLVLPDVNAGNTQMKAADITGSDNSFYDLQNKVFKIFPGGPGAKAQNLPIAGSLPTGFDPAHEEGAAAQFRVKYTVSLLDAGGEPVGVSYDGPSEDQAVAPQTGGG